MTHDATATWTIVVAAGTGTRFGGDTPKQFVQIAGKRVVDWSVAAAAAISDGVVVVMPQDSCESVSIDGYTGVVLCVPGGATRSESVRHGLAAVDLSARVILVHDAARPLASPELFQRVVAAIHDGAAAAVPVVPVVDTLRDTEGNNVDRAKLQAVQTPQGFAAQALRAAHAGEGEATDDATLVAAAGGQITAVVGDRWNIKVTEPTDEIVVQALLEARRS